jgi:hypothetical protein
LANSAGLFDDASKRGDLLESEGGSFHRDEHSVHVIVLRCAVAASAA